MAVIKVQQAQETKLTRLAFLNRFTDAEAVVIDLASIDDPTGTQQERTGQASIRRYLNKINAATFVDVARDDTIAGVNALESLGLLASGRADEILSTTIDSDERPS